MIKISGTYLWYIHLDVEYVVIHDLFSTTMFVLHCVPLYYILFSVLSKFRIFFSSKDNSLYILHIQLNSPCHKFLSVLFTESHVPKQHIGLHKLGCVYNSIFLFLVWFRWYVFIF